MRVALTKLFVASVSPPQQGQIDYWDTSLTNFGIRVSPKGKMSWTLRYRFKRRQRRLGHMASRGTPRLVLTKLLNHSDGSVTSVYDRHSYDPEKRVALEAWERRLKEIVENAGATSNVLPMVSVRR